MDEGQKGWNDFDARKSANESMRPDFVSSAAGNDKTSETPGGDASGSGRSFLKDNEASASDGKKLGGVEEGDNTLGAGEDNVESESVGDRFKNSVQGLKNGAKGKGKMSGGGFKKGGPVAGVIGLVLSFFFGSFMSQMSMPFSLVAQLRESFDSISVSQNMRTGTFLRYQMDRGLIKSPIKQSLNNSIFGPNKFKVSKRQQRKLAKHGITFEGKGKKMEMNFKGRTIVADKSLATDGKVYFGDLYESDPEFRDAYYKGACTWRGSVSAWFDKATDKLLSRLGVQRGVWQNYRSGLVRDGDTDSADTVRKTIAENADSDGIEGKSEAYSISDEVAKDENGNPKKDKNGNVIRNREVSKSDDSQSISRNDLKTDASGKVTDSSGLETKLHNIADGVTKAQKAITLLANLACTAADIARGISSLVAAYQVLEVVKTVMPILEAIQKAQAGDPDASPIHEIAKALTTPKESTYTKTTSVKQVGDTDEVEVDGESTVTRSRSAMESAGISALYGGTVVDGKDPSASSFNTNSTTPNFISSIAKFVSGFKATSFKACTIARMTTAAAAAVKDAFDIIGCALSFGLGCVVDAIIDAAEGIAADIAIGMVKSIAVAVLKPYVIKVLTRGIATQFLGEDLGNAVATGVGKIMGDNGRQTGQSIASLTSLISYYQEQDKVIADTARFERESRSPFDITSKYTFIGSLATNLMPIATKMSSLTGMLSGFGTVVNNSLTSLTPQSSAVSASIRAQAASDYTEEYCPELYDIGGVGDFACNPYIITDTSTMGMSPLDVIDKIDDNGNFVTDKDGEPLISENGNLQIKEDSPLAKYILFCGQRESQFGVADINIANTFGSGDGALSQFVHKLPVVGNTMDAIAEAKKLANMGWITGESCVTGNITGSSDMYNTWTDEKGYGEEKPLEKRGDQEWQETKYFQRFVEDQRLSEAEGLFEEDGEGEGSAVTEFLEGYYKEHPLDNSYEGILARYSGLTKDDVISYLGLFEVMAFSEEYEPSGLAPYPATIEEAENISISENYVVIYDQYSVVSYQDYYYSPRNEYYIS